MPILSSRRRSRNVCGGSWRTLIFRRFAEPNFPETFREAMACDLDRFGDLIRQRFAEQLVQSYSILEQSCRIPTEAEIDDVMPYVLSAQPRSADVTTTA